MAFRFRLEPLIAIRDNVLKEKQGELAKAYEARRIVEEKRREIESELESTRASGRQVISGGGQVNVEYLLGMRRQEMFLVAERDDCDQKIRMIDEQIELRRQAVVEANKELKIVEKLKEKRKERYDTEQARLDTVLMDEIASNKPTPRTFD